VETGNNSKPDIPVAPDPEDHTDFITTYKPVAGWKAIHMWWNAHEDHVPGGFWEPWATSPFAFKSKAAAELYARDWATDEECRYVPNTTEN